MNLSPFASKFIWSFVSSLSERFLICFLFASIFMFDRFCCLIFLRSLRFLFAMRVFDLFPMAPCLWWESEKTHAYFSTYLFLVSPNFSIISLNWAILAWMFLSICSTLLIVILLFTADAERAVLVSVLEGFDASEILGLDFFIPILSRSTSRWWKRVSALRTSCSASLRIRFMSNVIVRSYFGPRPIL